MNCSVGGRTKTARVLSPLLAALMVCWPQIASGSCNYREPAWDQAAHKACARSKSTVTATLCQTIGSSLDEFDDSKSTAPTTKLLSEIPRNFPDARKVVVDASAKLQAEYDEPGEITDLPTLQEALDLASLLKDDARLAGLRQEASIRQTINLILKDVRHLHQRLLILRDLYFAAEDLAASDQGRTQILASIIQRKASLSQIPNAHSAFLRFVVSSPERASCFGWLSEFEKSIADALGKSYRFEQSIAVIPQLIRVSLNPERFESVLEVVRPSLSAVDGLVVAEELHWSITPNPSKPHFLLPLGISFRKVEFKSSDPLLGLSAALNGASFDFDQKQFANTLNTLYPLPGGFSYSSRAQRSVDDPNKIVVEVQILGPGPIGTLIPAKLSLAPITGGVAIAEFVNALASTGGASSDRPEAFAARIQATIAAALARKEIEINGIKVKSLRINWERWHRGDHGLVANIDWPAGFDADLKDVLPKVATLTPLASASEALSLGPIAEGRLREILMGRMAANFPDGDLLNKALTKFGRSASPGIPLEWIRLEDISLSPQGITLQATIVLGDSVESVTIRLPSPYRPSDIDDAVKELTGGMAKAIATAMVEQPVASNNYEDLQKALKDTQIEIAGLRFKVDLDAVSGRTATARVQTTLAGTAVVISNVRFSFVDRRPEWSFERAAMAPEAALVLAKHLLASSTAKSLLGSSVEILSANLKGGHVDIRASTSFLGHSIPLVICLTVESNLCSKSPRDSIRNELIRQIQKWIDSTNISWSGVDISGLVLCPQGADKGLCGEGRISAEGDYTVGNLFTGKVEVDVHPRFNVRPKEPSLLPGFSAEIGVLGNAIVKVSSISPFVISGQFMVGPFAFVPAQGPVEFQWSAATGKISILSPKRFTIPLNFPIAAAVLTEVTIPLGKESDGSYRVGVVLAFGTEAIVGIRGDLAVRTEPLGAKLQATAAILTIPFFKIDASVETKPFTFHGNAETVGVLKTILDIKSKTSYVSDQCLMTGDGNVKFFFIKGKGDLTFQLPGCKQPSARAANCGLTAKGGICIRSTAGISGFSKQSVFIKASLDNMSFRADYFDERRIEPFGSVQVTVQVRQTHAKVKVRVPRRRLTLGFVVRDPGKDIGAIVNDLLKETLDPRKVKHLLKGNIPGLPDIKIEVGRLPDPPGGLPDPPIKPPRGVLVGPGGIRIDPERSPFPQPPIGGPSIRIVK